MIGVPDVLSTATPKRHINMNAVVRLYRELFRMTRRLPPESWPYYRRYLRENFETHREEDDPSRILFLLDKARQHAEWILQQYGIVSHSFQCVMMM